MPKKIDGQGSAYGEAGQAAGFHSSKGDLKNDANKSYYFKQAHSCWQACSLEVPHLHVQQPTHWTPLVMKNLTDR